MIVYLFETNHTLQKHIDSLFMALQCYQEPTTVISDYEIPNWPLDHVTYVQLERTELLAKLEQETGNVLVANTETIFIAEAFGDVVAAHNNWSTNDNLMIQLITPNAVFENVMPTMMFYGGGRIWYTGTRLFTNENFIPVAYGSAKIIFNSITQVVGPQPFNDKIFHGGPTSLVSPFPALAYNTQFGIPVKITTDAFDAEMYIESIPST